jgi:hypothetical protein
VTTSASLRALAFLKRASVPSTTQGSFLIRFALVDLSKPDDTIFDKDCDRFGLCITKRETP